MPFDPATFEAEVALKLIPTEQLPAAAQDALEAGFDGPHVLRMAILDPSSQWEIDQVLPTMLAEVGCHSISLKEAALRLAHQRARSILATDEDPLPSLPYFHRLMFLGDYPEELIEIGYLQDNFDFIDFIENFDEQRASAIAALKDLLSPELREKRRVEKLAAWERQREEARKDWPYVFDSPKGRSLLKEKYKERLADIRPIFVIEAFAWLLVGWAFSAWRIATVGYIVTVPILIALALWSEYRRLKRKRHDILLRSGVPDDQI
jgi:hypothetical protein